MVENEKKRAASTPAPGIRQASPEVLLPIISYDYPSCGII
jgi:hypothetical protein